MMTCTQALAVGAVGVLVLTSCGGESDDAGDSTQTPSDSQTSHTPAPYEPSSRVPTKPGPDGLIRPGALLDWGSPAQVSYFADDFDDTERGRLTITPLGAPRRVPIASLPHGADAEGAQVAYVLRWKIANSGKQPVSVADVTPGATDRHRYSLLTFSTTTGSCRYSPEDVLQPGRSLTTCHYLYSDDPSPLVTVEYDDDGQYDDQPVMWLAPSAAAD